MISVIFIFCVFKKFIINVNKIMIMILLNMVVFKIVVFFFVFIFFRLCSVCIVILIDVV